MKYSDLEYYSSNIASILEIPVRIYKNNIYSFFNFSTSLIKDPIILNEKQLFELENEIGYITTKDFFYYGYINYKEYRIVFGPFRLIRPDDAIITKMALELSIAKENINDFINSIKSINTLSLENVLKAMCMLYYIIFKEKISLKDILIRQEKNNVRNNNLSEEYKKNDDDIDNNYQNNTYNIEHDLAKIVKNGDKVKLNDWLNSVPLVKPGILSNDTLRQSKNTFIAAATIISRAAIDGGMDALKALSLSDLYIQKMELLQNSQDINILQMNMLIDYTNKVFKIKGRKNSSLLLINLNKYILSHLSDAIKIDDICKKLYISKSSLFEKIKKETNLTISNYILQIKINEAKELLKDNKQSITSISIYLGFSSHSHFNHAFKKITNMTPLQYRKK